MSSAQVQSLAEFRSTCDTRITAAFPTNSLDIRSSESGLRVAGLVGVGHLDQTYYRRDGAHQAHQPAGECSCPQEAGRHPVDGVTEVGHALEGREELCSHLPVELREAAGGHSATF